MARDSAPLLVDAQTTGVKEMAMVPAEQPRPTSDLGLVIERLATHPDVDVAKLEKIIELQERIMRHNARAAFDAAFAQMQPELPDVSEKGQIIVKGTLRSTYARLEDIHHAIKPILAKHGFAIRHRTEWPPDLPGIIRIVGILSHGQGHSEESVFQAPMDRSEYRTDIQSMGSTVSYGRRYTTLDLLNITTRGKDDDGQKSGRPTPPDGYAKWWTAMQSAASKGLKAFEPAWECSDAELKTFAVNHDKDALRELKITAAKGGAR